MRVSVEAMATRLERAWRERQPIEPLSSEYGLEDVETAYAVQQKWVQLRLAAGDRITGRKIGLTSRAMQEQFGVGEPDFGTLTAGLEIPVSHGVARVGMDRFLQPRVEGEIAFLLKDPLRGPGVTVVDVFRATAAVAAAIEVVDSRIRDWRIQLVDTVADNASAGAYALGPWCTRWQEIDLALAGMVLWVDGEIVGTGAGAAALGHPASCVAWLANKLGSMGVQLEAGDVILSGSLARAVPVQAGNTVRVEVGGLHPVTVHFDTGS